MSHNLSIFWITLFVCVSLSSSQQIDSNVCRSAGFFRDPKNCAQFYRCVAIGNYFQLYRFTCPAGTVWDPTLDTCNYPYAAPPCEDGQSEDNDDDDQQSIDEQNEGSEENDGQQQQPQEPQEPQEPQPEPEPAPQEPSQQEDDNNDDDDDDEQNQQDEQQEDEKLKRTSNRTVIVVIPKTTKRPTVMFTTRKSTPKFIWRRRPTIKAKSGADNSPNISLFKTKSARTPTSNATVPQIKTFTSNSDFECTEEGYFRDPEDCNAFFRCVNLLKLRRYDFKCASDLHFDEKYNACNWSHEAYPRCGDTHLLRSALQHQNKSVTNFTSKNGPINVKPKLKAESQVKLSKTNNQSKSPNTPKPQLRTTRPPVLTARPKQPIQRNNNHNRQNTQNKRINLFSPKPQSTKGAQHRHAIPSIQTRQESKQLLSVNTGTKRRTSHNSNNYLTIQKFRTKFAPKSPVITYNKRNISEYQCISEGFFRDSYDCNKFYRCVRNPVLVSYSFRCEEGLYFDQRLDSCNWPQLVSPRCSPSQEINYSSVKNTKSK